MPKRMMISLGAPEGSKLHLENDACEVTGCIPVPEKPIRPRPDSVVQYVAIGRAVMKGQEHIATACSNTMARRIANALRKYVPNRKGV